jgi:hypothetical protein
MDDRFLSARSITHPWQSKPMARTWQWLGAFACPAENVIEVVGEIRASPLMPTDVLVSGLIFCLSY